MTTSYFLPFYKLDNFQIKEKQEETERERVKYLLIISGLRKKRKLERPLLLIQTVNSFINDTLKIQECSNLTPNIYFP